MRFAQSRCRVCGAQAFGLLEIVFGVAELQAPDAHGRVDYGFETHVDWDSQEAVESDGRVILVCECGHRWLTTRLPDKAPDWALDAMRWIDSAPDHALAPAGAAIVRARLAQIVSGELTEDAGTLEALAYEAVSARPWGEILADYGLLNL